MHDSFMRTEVLEFVLASEVLLSPTLCPPDLTEEECGLIAEFIVKLSTPDYPWSKSLPARHPYAETELDLASRQCEILRSLITDHPDMSQKFDVWMASRRGELRRRR